jgi:hypothetical protein
MFSTVNTRRISNYITCSVRMLCYICPDCIAELPKPLMRAGMRAANSRRTQMPPDRGLGNSPNTMPNLDIRLQVSRFARLQNGAFAVCLLTIEA